MKFLKLLVVAIVLCCLFIGINSIFSFNALETAISLQSGGGDPTPMPPDPPPPPPPEFV